MASVKVAVRVRPFNQRELDMEASCIIQMRGKKTGILNHKANTRDEAIRNKEFTFDHSYWSHDTSSKSFASQEMVYNDLGTEVVDCAFEGYNACVFAYGQTGSGKTFTMMGSPDNQGLIPRICKALFEQMAADSKRGTTHRVQVSYLEIYQERVADLLRGDDSDAQSLKVREHPKRGQYVQGLTSCLVTNYGHIHECMERGNSFRTTASTNMNDVSSRSHAIFTITFVQAGFCDGVPSETVSKIHLVDLAGSERADSTGATGQRLKEGAHINKSLVTLGSVISALAELSADNNSQKKAVFIPYRDSVLTWLLKDSLGGNSKTIMIAAISPADCNYGETLSTLRYANRAKNIINKPTVNEDPNVKLIRELRDEISKLKTLMFNEHQIRSDTMLAKLHEKEAREKELTEEWTCKWREAQAILREQRALGLRKAGPGVVLDSDRPHLVAIDDDPLSTGVTLYHLKEGETTIGTEESSQRQDIVLKGPGMEAEHCTIKFEQGVALLTPHAGAQVWLNNTLIEDPARLFQGCIIFLGRAHVFRFNDPAEAAEMRRGERSHLARMSLLSWSTPDLAVSMENLPKLTGEDHSDLEAQRLCLVKEKQRFEKEQEAFERRRKSLEEAQAKLEAEKREMEEEHAAQARQLQENWRNLTAIQKHREQELQRKEIELVEQREELEKERQRIMGEIDEELEAVNQCRSVFLTKLKNTFKFLLSDGAIFSFEDLDQTRVVQDLVNKSETYSLSDSESDYLVDLLNGIQGKELLEDLVNQHRKELAELQAELERRVVALTERRTAVEKLDKKLVGLVDEQIELGVPAKEENLQFLRDTLASRTEQQLREIEQRKQALNLNLKRINSAQSPDSLDTNYTSSLDHGTLSSDTYHTATSACSTSMFIVEGIEKMMSDSGVELRPGSRPPYESDLSSNEDSREASDSQSSSSVENRSPVIRKRKKDKDVLRNLAQRVTLQKQLIIKSLDSQCSKIYLDAQIAILQDLQKQYLAVKAGSPSILSPAAEHPLQDLDSPSPMRPLHAGSTSALYSPPLPRSQLAPYSCLYRSMPSISTQVDSESIVSIASYCLRGTGSQTHYEYEVRIRTADERWCVMRRFRRFRDLHIAMKARYGEKVAQIPFPSRQLFANTEAVAQSRKKQLEMYLKRLIDVCKAHPNCCLAYETPVTRATLQNFSPFFRKGLFENGKYGTS
ncbi:kinesin-like protein Klp98A isoform X2 [Atheta coriaria]|uniref:kinesin-like protein Klp98A isoform X2 n=1 Tax=Dalotia coriaria TaxID=877792 RepID=UPI0031F47082